jgi:peptidyl-prolyl cis-trans isomerase A (cyclophilin A)
MEQSMSSRFTFKSVCSAAVVLGAVAALTAQAGKASLKNPAALKETAPAKYSAKFDTSAGTFVVEVTRAWAPNGADRFYNLVKSGYFDGCRFFRVVEGFMVQFGINGDPAVNSAWMSAKIQDDPVKESNTRGMVTFAQTSELNSRGTQVFVNFGDNKFLDATRFAPFGKVTTGMDVVDKLYNGYGEGAPRGKGPDQNRIQTEGNAYLTKDFPKMDYVKTATIEGGAAAPAAPAKKKQ